MKKVICIAKPDGLGSPYEITIGKVYNATESKEKLMGQPSYLIIDDLERLDLIQQVNFIPLQEHREKQLENLGI